MNRLWVRLSLAFTAVVLLGFGAVVFGTISLTSDQRMQSLLLNQFERPSGLIDAVAEYYRSNGSWEGVRRADEWRAQCSCRGVDAWPRCCS